MRRNEFNKEMMKLYRMETDYYFQALTAEKTDKAKECREAMTAMQIIANKLDKKTYEEIVTYYRKKEREYYEKMED